MVFSVGLLAKKYHYSVRNVAMVCVAAVALGSSIYARFVNNNKVTAEVGDYAASTAQYLLISHATEDDFKISVSFDSYTGTLVPVSTTDNTMRTFWWVDSSKVNAWDNSKAKIFKYATASASGNAYHDSFELKSDQAGVQVQCKITKTADANGLGSAVYVVFKCGNLTKPLNIQLSNGDAVTGGIGDGSTSDDTDSTNNCTKKGIKNLDSNFQVASANMDSLTVTNYYGFDGNAFNFDTLTASGTAKNYEMYIWLEGTDPQCYNQIVAKQLTGLCFEFSIPEV